MLKAVNNVAPRLSIIMPVLNEERYIEKTLASLADQTASQSEYEVLIFDANSTDKTCEIVKEWEGRIKNLWLDTNDGRLPASGRNLGLSRARGDYVAFVEGHCILPHDYVERAIELFERKEPDALGRPINLVVPSDSPLQRSIGIARMSSLGHARDSLLYSNAEGFHSSVSCATIYRAGVFDRLGKFDERLPVAEDVDFNMRFEAAGFSHYFSQDLACFYHPRRTYREFWKQMYSYGLGRLRSARQRGMISTLDFVLLPFLVCLCVTLIVGFWNPLAWLIPATYASCMSMYALYLAASHGQLRLWGYVSVALMTIHVGMAIGLVGGIMECVMPSRERGGDE